MAKWDTFPFINIRGCDSGPDLSCVPWHRSILMVGSNNLFYCYSCWVIQIIDKKICVNVLGMYLLDLKFGHHNRLMADTAHFYVFIESNFIE